MIDDTITDIDSPVFCEAKWFDPDLELYDRHGGTYAVSDISLQDWQELYRERDHDCCLKILQEHPGYRYISRR